MSNHLTHETSPYLLQHAENPVDWYPWVPEALEKARRQDKPIFLSIGYAACHWCHVMAHESFEDARTAAVMNAHFVNIKVDREERPDLDSIYMQAVVALTGQGGWPMSLFLTPEGVPFYGGTYFPPVRRYNMPAFSELLQAIAHAWETERAGLLDNGQQLLDHLRQQVVGQGGYPVETENIASLRDTLDQAAMTLAQNYDWTGGGWGSAPRFPQPMAIEYLLRRAAPVSDSVVRGDRLALDMALHALQAMSRGGMYDVVGGGFARYSTDDQWLVPHFEKMLYDNAQLARAYLHAYLICRDEGAPFVGARTIVPQQMLRVCERTLDFVLREMTHPQGGFFSSLDADSEGDEGKFYVWAPDEIRQALGDESDADFVIAAYHATEEGNFDGKNVLQRSMSDKQLAERFGMEVDSIPDRLEALHARLLQARSRRVRPATDDKVLAGWNGLMLAAFAEAAFYLGREDYLAAAQRNAHFLLENLIQEGKLVRSWREPSPLSSQGLSPLSPGPFPPMGEGENSGFHPAYLEDHAALVLGLLALYQADGDVTWYTAALRLAEEMTAHFSDPGDAGAYAIGFFDTRDDAETLLYRPKDLQDNATPSGNALAACALLQLAAFGDRLDFRSPAEAMLESMQERMKRHPTAFAQWLQAADFALVPTFEVAVVGEMDHPMTAALRDVLRKRYRPHLVAAASSHPPLPGSPALLHDRPLKDGLPTAYVCQAFVCQQPVNSPQEMEKQLEGYKD
jgi:hypothetical protein